MSNFKYIRNLKVLLHTIYIDWFPCRVILPGFKLEKKKTYFDIFGRTSQRVLKKLIYLYWTFELSPLLK